MSTEEDLYNFEELYSQISKRAAALESVIKQKEADLSNYPKDLPKGTLRIVMNGKNHTRQQFFWLGTSGGKCGKYIKKAGITTAQVKELVQREYDEKLLKASKKEYCYLKKGKKFSLKNPLVAVYDSMGIQKQKWLNPIILNDSKYAEKWKKEKSPANYKTDNKIFVTKQKEYVRSKSELLIANALYDHSIPYHYESSPNQQSLHTLPDFTVLNIRKKREYLWEHFGMMSDPGYCACAIKKIRNYEKHNIFPGQNIIYTFESSDVPLDTNTIERIIQIFLL